MSPSPRVRGVPMSDPLPWDVLGSSYLARKPWLTLRQDRVRLPGRAVIEEYFVLESPAWAHVGPVTSARRVGRGREYPPWVTVVAVPSEGRVVLVRQYRQGLGRVGVELPGGVVDPGDPSPES